MDTVCLLTASDAFNKQIQQLCINEFPCSMGKWRESYGKKVSEMKIESNKTRFSVALQDYDANKERVESLHHLANDPKSPWQRLECQADELRLRKIAIDSPWIISDKFLNAFFESIRVVDCNIGSIDAGMKRFHNLKELTLSANYISQVHSLHLPKNLQVLELCGNNVKDLYLLSENAPPNLNHLGLAHNCISSIDNSIQDKKWPNLLSLDLGHNSLADLKSTIASIKTLKKLHNLILIGNPLALAECYRGYVVDSLQNLTYLDDVVISADEWHNFIGLAICKECKVNQARISFEFKTIKNIPMPEEIKCPDLQPEYPIVTRSYFVQFTFPKEQNLVEGSIGLSSTFNSPKTCDISTPRIALNNQDLVDNDLAGINDLDNFTSNDLYLVQSPPREWTSDPQSPGGSGGLEIHWMSQQRTCDLGQLRHFLSSGVDILVFEHKFQWTQPVVEEETSRPNSKTKKVEAKKKPKSAGKKGAKKNPNEKLTGLIKSAPQISKLCSFHVDLKSLMDSDGSENEIKEVRQCELNDPMRFSTPECDESKKDSGRSKTPSEKKKKVDKKSPDTKSKIEVDLNHEDELPPIPMLQVDYGINLHHFTSTNQCKQQAIEMAETLNITMET